MRARETSRRSGRHLFGLAISLAVLVASGLVIGVRAATSTPTNTVTADFTEAPGIYVGNHVDVLGIPVGSVMAVTPHSTYVSVVMRVDRSVKVPAHAIAALMAPDLVNDRYIQLDPVYRHGAVMANQSVIPMSRTALPQSVDQTISVLDQLIQALGPSGINKSGALSRFVHDVAQTVGHNGPSFHTTIVALGGALSALSGDGPSITSILDNVGTFTSEAASNDQEVQAFANDLASVSGIVAADSTDIGTTLAALPPIMAQVTSFVNANRSAISAVLQKLGTFTSQVLTQQQALTVAFADGGLVLQDLNNVIVTKPDGSTALRIRYDPSLDTSSLVQEVCGNELARVLNLATEQAKSSELDLACVASSALSQISAPPDANQGPNLSLGALIGAQP